MGHGGFKLQVQQFNINPTATCLEESHGKDGKQRAFPTFPRHGYGYLYESIPEICCTWNLNVPTQSLWADQGWDARLFDYPKENEYIGTALYA
jgi:hypothetical protein